MKIINESEIFKVNPNYTAELVKLGGTGNVTDTGSVSVLVVDDFYQNPESIRDLVLSIPCTKFSPDRVNHVNKNSNINITYDLRSLVATYQNLIENYFPKKGFERFADHRVLNTIFSKHPFAVNVMQSKDRNIIPLSHPSTGFFSEIFLNIEGECAWGSSFYSDTSNCIGVIPMEFNRMLLFDNRVFHNPYMEKDSFVDDIFRISQLLYINDTMIQ